MPNSSPTTRRATTAPSASVTWPRANAEPGAPPADGWAELVARVEEMSTPSGAFFLMVTLSTVIAVYGLLSNSTAVVIGAMLVAPLMGPIFGIALGLASGDTSLLARAAGAELKGMAVSVGLALLVGLVPDHPAFATEILSRTHPTVYDVIVAVASGLAGAFALADRRVNAALPGVAIATAIVPPLATVGLCLSAGRFDLAGGAFLLFLANLLAIEAVAAAYFTWVGVRRGHLHEQLRLREFVAHFGVSAVLLAAVGVFLTRTLLAGITNDRRRDQIRGTLGDELRLTQGARLSDLTFETTNDTVHVFAVVMTPQEVAPPQVARMESALRQDVHAPVSLVVRSLIARDADRAGPVYVAADEVAQQASAEVQTRMLARASETLRARFAAMPGVELDELRRDRVPIVLAARPFASAAGATPVPTVAATVAPTISEPGAPAAAGAAPAPRPSPLPPAVAVDTIDVLTAVVRTPTPVLPAQVDTLTGLLRAALGVPVRLVVRSVLTRDADASGFLYERALGDSLPALGPASAPADSAASPATNASGRRPAARRAPRQP